MFDFLGKIIFLNSIVIIVIIVIHPLVRKKTFFRRPYNVHEVMNERQNDVRQILHESAIS